MAGNSPVMVVTGSRKGIGRHLARHYAARGYEVFGCSRQDADLKLRRYTHFRLDVSDEAAVKDFFAEIKGRRNRLDVLLNNAGIAQPNHSLLTPAGSVTSVLATNVLGTFLFCREAAKLMRQRSWGRIVNFATTAVALKIPGEAVYAASKAAVVTLTEVLAREFAGLGITVNTVAPTPMQTDFLADVENKKVRAVLDLQVLKRRATMADVENAVDFFLKKESGFITAQTLYLGGVSR